MASVAEIRAEYLRKHTQAKTDAENSVSSLTTQIETLEKQRDKEISTIQSKYAAKITPLNTSIKRQGEIETEQRDKAREEFLQAGATHAKNCVLAACPALGDASLPETERDAHFDELATQYGGWRKAYYEALAKNQLGDEYSMYPHVAFSGNAAVLTLAEEATTQESEEDAMTHFMTHMEVRHHKLTQGALKQFLENGVPVFETLFWGQPPGNIESDTCVQGMIWLENFEKAQAGQSPVV